MKLSKSISYEEGNFKSICFLVLEAAAIKYINRCFEMFNYIQVMKPFLCLVQLPLVTGNVSRNIKMLSYKFTFNFIY